MVGAPRKKGRAAREVAKRSEETTAKAPPCPERRMRVPLPQQSSSSTMEEESPWKCSRKDGYGKDGAVREQQCIQLNIDEVEECSFSPEYADVVEKQIFRKAARGGRTFF